MSGNSGVSPVNHPTHGCIKRPVPSFIDVPLVKFGGRFGRLVCPLMVIANHWGSCHRSSKLESRVLLFLNTAAFNANPDLLTFGSFTYHLI